MKKWLYAMIIVIVLAAAFTVNYLISSFSLGDSTKLSREALDIGDNYYLSYGLHWEGYLHPEVIELDMRSEDGSLISEMHDQVEVEYFIDKKKHTGAMDESEYQKYRSEGLIDYVPVSDAPMEEDNQLVLRVLVKDEAYIETVDTMILRYKILGILKEQVLKFDGFLEMEEDF
jgi:hypothetical protein